MKEDTGGEGEETEGPDERGVGTTGTQQQRLVWEKWASMQRTESDPNLEINDLLLGQETGEDAVHSRTGE